MWSLKEFVRVLSLWRRNGHTKGVSEIDIAIVTAWNYDKVNDDLIADVLSYYKIDAIKYNGLKDFVNKTLY